MARTRSAFRKLAEVRAREAKALLDARLWDGAYYLAGYAVECALKACIAKLTRPFEFPDKEFAAKCWTHDIRKLVERAGLKAPREADAPPGSARADNWDTVHRWDEKQRYERKGRAEAVELYEAITDPIDGVLPWIAGHW